MFARPDDIADTQKMLGEPGLSAGSNQPGTPAALYASKETVLTLQIRSALASKWSHLPELTRWARIQEVAHQLHRILSISLPMPHMELQVLSFDKAMNIVSTSVVEGDTRIGGRYSFATNTIVINRAQLMMDDPKEILLTIAHEMRHVYQQDQVRLYLGGSKADTSATVWETEIHNPVSPTVDYRRYSEQSVEVDARAYAEAFVAKIGL